MLNYNISMPRYLSNYYFYGCWRLYHTKKTIFCLSFDFWQAVFSNYKFTSKQSCYLYSFSLFTRLRVSIVFIVLIYASTTVYPGLCPLCWKADRWFCVWLQPGSWREVSVRGVYLFRINPWGRMIFDDLGVNKWKIGYLSKGNFFHSF